MKNDPDIENDAILKPLATLSTPSLDHSTSERIRRRAAFAFERYSQKHPMLGVLGRTYSRVEPVLVGAISMVYLLWAFRTVLALQ